MDVSETILVIVASRLAVLLLMGLAAKALPPQPQHTPLLVRPAVVAPPLAGSAIRDRTPTNELIRDMLDHD